MIITSLIDLVPMPQTPAEWLAFVLAVLAILWVAKFWLDED